VGIWHVSLYVLNVVILNLKILSGMSRCISCCEVYVLPVGISTDEVSIDLGISLRSSDKLHKVILNDLC